MFKLSAQLNIRHLFGTHKKQSVRKGDMYPAREWLLGLFVFLILVVCGGLYNSYKFLEYKNIHMSGGSFNEQVPSYNPASVEQSLEIFKKRKEAYELLQKKAPQNVVPSVSEVVVASTSPTTTATSTLEAVTASTTVSSGVE